MESRPDDKFAIAIRFKALRLKSVLMQFERQRKSCA